MGAKRLLRLAETSTKRLDWSLENTVAHDRWDLDIDIHRRSSATKLRVDTKHTESMFAQSLLCGCLAVVKEARPRREAQQQSISIQLRRVSSFALLGRRPAGSRKILICKRRVASRC